MHPTCTSRPPHCTTCTTINTTTQVCWAWLSQWEGTDGHMCVCMYVCVSLCALSARWCLYVYKSPGGAADLCRNSIPSVGTISVCSVLTHRHIPSFVLSCPSRIRGLWGHLLLIQDLFSFFSHGDLKHCLDNHHRSASLWKARQVNNAQKGDRVAVLISSGHYDLLPSPRKRRQGSRKLTLAHSLVSLRRMWVRRGPGRGWERRFFLDLGDEISLWSFTRTDPLVFFHGRAIYRLWSYSYLISTVTVGFYSLKPTATQDANRKNGSQHKIWRDD